MLWQVESSALHILGSVHVLTEPPQFNLTELKVLEDASVFVFEANFELRQATTNGAYSGRRKLFDDVPDHLFQQTKQLCSDLRLDGIDEVTLRPWCLAFKIMQVLLRQRGFDHHKGVDYAVLQIAKKRRAELFFLEPSGTGGKSFAEAPLQEQQEMLRRAVQHADEGLADVASMVSAWSSRSPAQLVPLRDKYLKQIPKAYARALGGRNRDWIPKLLRLLKSGRPTIATVGALHMVGPDGIPALLEQVGYACTPVRSNE